MKMIYNGTPVNSMKVKHYEMDTNSATVQPSDMQAGTTCFARGKKITGTGKCFEFAQYGSINTNIPLIIPNTINVVEIASTTYPIKSAIAFSEIANVDFTTSQMLGSIFIDDVEYPITITVNNGMLILSCNKSTKLQFFFGKDNYLL